MGTIIIPAETFCCRVVSFSSPVLVSCEINLVLTLEHKKKKKPLLMDQSSPLVFCGLSPRRNLISQSGSQVSAKPLCCCTKEESTVSPGVVYHTDLIVSSFSVIRIWFINVLLFLLKSCVFILL